MESADPKARRKAAESELAVQQDVAGMLVKVKADSKMTRLSVDPNNFLNFKATTFEIFLASTVRVRVQGHVAQEEAHDRRARRAAQFLRVGDDDVRYDGSALTPATCGMCS